MDIQKLNLFKEKRKQIRDLSNVISKYQQNIESIDYQVFEKLEDAYYCEEFIIINYKGGAFTAKPCNWNSFSANFSLISAYLESGDYQRERYNHAKTYGRLVNLEEVES